MIISLLKKLIVDNSEFTSKHYHEIPILPNIHHYKKLKM